MSMPTDYRPLLCHGELLEIKRWDTPTIYNGWTKITDSNECHTVIHAGRNASRKTTEQLLAEFDEAFDAFDAANGGAICA
jgi:hypothetical protein